jgi:hypothetical protein
MSGGVEHMLEDGGSSENIQSKLESKGVSRQNFLAGVLKK